VPPTIKAAFMPQVKASVLETSDGFALYIFQIDNRGKPTCFGTCAQVWPPVLLGPGQSAVAGSGVQASLLGSESYSNGKSVVTYAGWPLYKYVSDTTPGVAAGQGLDLNGGFWYVMRPNGQPIVPPGDPPVP
jgi:predicted lipoprotein with Yx(FWY)xxD motif